MSDEFVQELQEQTVYLRERLQQAELQLSTQQENAQRRLEKLQQRALQAESRSNLLQAELEILQQQKPVVAPAEAGPDEARCKAAEERALAFELEARELHHLLVDRAPSEVLPALPAEPLLFKALPEGRVSELLAQNRRLVGYQKALFTRLTQAEKSLEGEQKRSHSFQLELTQLNAAPAAPVNDPEVERLAYRDELTGLANQNLMWRYLSRVNEQIANQQSVAAVVVLDIDRLRSFNLSLGFEAGDEILRYLGQQLQSCLRPTDVLARWAEDEYLAAVEIPVGPNQQASSEAVAQVALALASKLLEQLRKPLPVANQQIAVTAHVGVAVCDPSVPARIWVERARLALKKAKSSKTAVSVLYDSKFEQAEQRRVKLLPSIKQALSQDQFFLQFQPVLDIATQKIWGIETLLRWNHPTMGVLEPKDFLDVALDSGEILPIGQWVLSEAFALVAQLDRLYLSVNLSARELLQADFVRRFTKSMEVAQLSRPDHLIVEISENEFAQAPESIENVLKELATWKVQIAIDRFGLSSLSLQHLTSLKARYLKLDAGLVRGLKEPTGLSMCRATTQIAESLGCVSWAQGVETNEQLRTLQQIGCKLAQGSLVCPPVPAGSLRERLRLSGLA